MFTLKWLLKTILLITNSWKDIRWDIVVAKLACRLVQVSKDSPTRVGSYCQWLTHVKLRPVSEMQSARFFVCEPLKNGMFLLYWEVIFQLGPAWSLIQYAHRGGGNSTDALLAIQHIVYDYLDALNAKQYDFLPWILVRLLTRLDIIYLLRN